MTFRKNDTPRALFRKPASIELRGLAVGARDAAAGGARQAMTHGARLAAQKPARLTAGVAAAATIGAIAATAPWAGAAAGPVAQAHGGHAATVTTSHDAASKATSGGPQTIYDSVSPGSIPSGQHVATYSNGPFHASSDSVAGRGNVLWIDTNGSNPHADALDVEPGDATPAGAAQWVSHKLADNPKTDAIVYTFKAQWPAVQASIKALPAAMQSHVKYWIADPTGTPHIVPGASATQWYWGSKYDISMAQPGFHS